MKILRQTSLLVLLAVAFAACDSASPLEISNDVNTTIGETSIAAKYAFTDVVTDLKEGTFTICKSAPEEVSKAFTFNTTVVLGDINNQPLAYVPTVELRDGECEDVFVSKWGPDQVRIEELIPEGWDSVPSLEVWTMDNNGNVFQDPHDPGAVIEGAIEEGKAGCLVIFGNKKLEVPGGGQGCTPGYWKNNWSKKGGTAWTSFGGDYLLSSAGFSGFTVLDGDATTFADALAAKGGGESALMRHAAAAYLNAVHADISYDVSSIDIVSSTNSALAGDDAGVEDLKNAFDSYNNQGCPLNQHGYVK